MRVRIITLRYSSSLGGFDDGPIVDLQRDREILSCATQFFSVAELPGGSGPARWGSAAPGRSDFEEGRPGERRSDDALPVIDPRLPTSEGGPAR